MTVIAVDDAPELTLPAPYDDPTTPVPVEVGQSVQFTATALDPDTPPSELMFTLDLAASGIPAGRRNADGDHAARYRTRW